MSEPNLLGTKFGVHNRQVFCLYRLNQQRFPTFGLHLKYGLYRISIYKEFGLDRFHCTRNLGTRVVIIWWLNLQLRYLCNQCLSPLTLWVWIPLRCVLDTTLCDKVYQWHLAGQWLLRLPPQIKLTVRI